jgi:hypothetical protein
VDPNKIEDVEASAPATVEHVNPADDVRNDVAEAIKSLKGQAAEAAPVEAEATADDHPEPIGKEDHPTDPARFADGKFKPTKSEAAPVEAAPDPKLPPVDNTAKPSTEQPSTAVGAAPVSWAAEAKASWASLPPAIQNAVLKREAEVSSGFRQKSEEVRRYEQVIAPVAQEAARLGLQPDQAINALMSAHHALQQNAPAAIARLAQQYGVDLATLASNPPAIQQQPRHDPMVSQLTQHVSKLESQLSGFLQNQTLGVVEKFASENPHYAAVEEDIARLIPMVQQANPGLPAHDVLSKAYEQAIWVNPDVRAKLIAEQTAQAQQKQAETIKVKSAQAAKAAVSIRGASNGASAPKMPTPASGGDVYDDVRAAINSLRQ